VIGLLCTSDGIRPIPIAHQVVAGNTSDASTLPGVLADPAVIANYLGTDRRAIERTNQ